MGHDANPANEHTLGMELARRGPSVPTPLVYLHHSHDL